MRSVLRESEHLFRMGGLFVVGILLFLVLRAATMPPEFGKYGHYRPGALDDAASRPLHFAGKESCETCHDDVAASRVGGKHEGVRCEACHGALARHAEDPVANPDALPRAVGLCEGCHARLAGRPAWFPQVEPKEHAEGDACTACHDPHDPGL